MKIQGKGWKEEFLPTIELGTDEWAAWERYFREYLGYDPIAMKRIRMGSSERMTVPTQYPEWFDTEYARCKAQS